LRMPRPQANRARPYDRITQRIWIAKPRANSLPTVFPMYTLTGKYIWYGNGVKKRTCSIPRDRISSGNRWPLAIYSKANRMKIKVETSKTQNASIAIVYDIKNCSSAVSNVERRNSPSEAQLGGRTKYWFRHKMKTASGRAATSRYV